MFILFGCYFYLYLLSFYMFYFMFIYFIFIPIFILPPFISFVFLISYFISFIWYFILYCILLFIVHFAVFILPLIFFISSHLLSLFFIVVDRLFHLYVLSSFIICIISHPSWNYCISIPIDFIPILKSPIFIPQPGIFISIVIYPCIYSIPHIPYSFLFSLFIQLGFP